MLGPYRQLGHCSNTNSIDFHCFFNKLGNCKEHCHGNTFVLFIDTIRPAGESFGPDDGEKAEGQGFRVCHGGSLHPASIDMMPQRLVQRYFFHMMIMIII